ncbi:SIR2 family protein [Halanaerobium saccharolyticum]|nr:SIR2 family protein [Halanaerobium saccharolyticum]
MQISNLTTMITINIFKKTIRFDVTKYILEGEIMINEYIKFLAEESKRDKLVIFVGAGVSMNSGLPSWTGLIDKFSDYLKIDSKDNYTPEETLLIPQIFYDKFGKIKYYEILNKAFGKKLNHNKIHDYLNKLSPNYIITTNYDKLIENRLNNPKKRYDVISKEEDLAHSQLNEMIIKMHGDLENKNVVLKKEDYDNYEDRFPLITTFIKSLFTTNTILFIGYSLNDINVKLIMDWIKEILKEDFRRVYLADLSNYNIRNKYSDENNKLVNRIFIRKLKINQDYLNNLSKNDKEDKGKLLANFLDKLIEKREELNSELRGSFFKDLNYIPDSEIKKIIKENNKKIYVRFNSYMEYDSSPYLIKELVIESVEENDTLYDFDISLLLKSNIEKINNKRITDFKKINIEKEELEKKQEINNKLFELLITYDFVKLNNIIEKEEISNKLFISYSYYMQSDFSKAKKELKIFIEKSSNPELILWGLFNLNLILWREKSFISFKNEANNIDLKKEYFNYFDNMHTDLYSEIFNNSLLKKYNASLNNLLFKIKENKDSSTLGGYSQIEKAQIEIREFLNHIFINGHIADCISETKNIFRNYVDIILYAYKNEVQNDLLLPGGKKNILDDFNYVDLFSMIQISFKELSTLFVEHNIKQLVVSKDNLKVLIASFNNFINHFLNINPNIKRHKNKLIDKFLLILTKIDLNKANIKKISDILTKKEIIKWYSSDTYSLIVKILNKNSEKVTADSIETFIRNYLITPNHYFDINKRNYVISFLSYIYDLKTEKKLDLKKELDEAELLDCITKENIFIDNEKSLETLLHLSNIIVDDLKNKIKNTADNYLKRKFSINIYVLMLRMDLINTNNDYENKIINQINNKFVESKSTSLQDERENFVREIIILNLEGYSSDDFKNSLKEIENDIFEDFLIKSKHYNIFYYSLNPDNFDFTSFNIEDLRMLNKNGLVDLLERDSKDELKKIIKNNLNKKYEDKYLNALLESEI